MKRVSHNGKKILLMLLVIGCMALVLLWPQWRDELRAEGASAENCSQEEAVALSAQCRQSSTCSEEAAARARAGHPGCLPGKTLKANCVARIPVDGPCELTSCTLELTCEPSVEPSN